MFRLKVGKIIMTNKTCKNHNLLVALFSAKIQNPMENSYSDFCRGNQGLASKNTSSERQTHLMTSFISHSSHSLLKKIIIITKFYHLLTIKQIFTLVDADFHCLDKNTAICDLSEQTKLANNYVITDSRSTIT